MQLLLQQVNHTDIEAIEIWGNIETTGWRCCSLVTVNDASVVPISDEVISTNSVVTAAVVAGSATQVN